jgi:hypothetical protein
MTIRERRTGGNGQCHTGADSNPANRPPSGTPHDTAKVDVAG